MNHFPWSLRYRDLPLNSVALAGALSLAIPVWLLMAWIAIHYRVDGGHEARVDAFLSTVPGFARDPDVLTLAALACSMAGAMSGLVCVRGGRGAVRAAGAGEIALGAALACLLVFSMM